MSCELCCFFHRSIIRPVKSKNPLPLSIFIRIRIRIGLEMFRRIFIWAFQPIRIQQSRNLEIQNGRSGRGESGGGGGEILWDAPEILGTVLTFREELIKRKRDKLAEATPPTPNRSLTDNESAPPISSVSSPPPSPPPFLHLSVRIHKNP